MTYSLNPFGGVVRDSDGALLSPDPSNTDTQAYQAWVAAGNAAAPYPAAAPTVTGNQWAFALADLGLSAAWQVGVAKSKAKDQVRIGLIARDTLIVASDPLLIRVAANAGTADGTASGAPLIDEPVVFARAQGMPL